jgi:hypothetical protein
MQKSQCRFFETLKTNFSKKQRGTVSKNGTRYGNFDTFWEVLQKKSPPFERRALFFVVIISALCPSRRRPQVP